MKLRRRHQAIGFAFCDGVETIAHRIDFLEAESAQRNQGAHPFITGENQDLDRIECDAERLQEILKMAMHDFADLRGGIG